MWCTILRMKGVGEVQIPSIFIYLSEEKRTSLKGKPVLLFPLTLLQDFMPFFGEFLSVLHLGSALTRTKPGIPGKKGASAE
jgi:hypothetical protein